MFGDFNLSEALRTSPVLLVILAASVVTLGLVLERALYFMKRGGNPDAVLAAALAKLRAGDLREAVKVCSASRHPAGAVLGQVLQNTHLRAEALEEKLQIALSEQRLLLERNLGVIGTMGNTAPLVGLLGTVWGIMRAFHDMARTGSAGPSVVAAGVAEALFTTAAGLLVAVPAVVLYNHFVRRISVMLTVAENHARSLRLVLEAPRPAPSAPAAAPGGQASRPEARPALARSSS